MSRTEQLSNDVKWFNTQINAWRGYSDEMARMLSILDAAPPISPLSDKFPEALATASRDMNDVVTSIKRSFRDAQESAEVFATKMRDTATIYIKEREEAGRLAKDFHTDLAP